MKNKKLIFGVLFAGVLVINTLVLSTNNNNDLQLNSLFTLASAQADENGENGEATETYYQGRTIVEMSGSIEAYVKIDIDGKILDAVGGSISGYGKINKAIKYNCCASGGGKCSTNYAKCEDVDEIKLLIGKYIN